MSRVPPGSYRWSSHWQEFPSAALVALAASVFVGGCGPSAPVLSVATLNLAHGRGLAISPVGLTQETFDANIDRVATLLRREGPHVVALQEADAPSVWSGSFDHVAELAARAGYPHRYHGLHVDVRLAGRQVGYGTALVSAKPLSRPASHSFGAEPLDTKGIAWARIVFAGRQLLVASVHLDSKFVRTRKKQAGEVVRLLKTPGLPVVLMGDFNCRYEHDDALRLIVSSLGLSAHRPKATDLATFPADSPAQRIDWILISPELRFVDYHAWPDRVSDHLGTAADITWRR